MAIQVVMPRLSDTMERGKIVRWLKREGSRVEGGEIIAEIETDKADIEMEAFGSGVLRKILVSEGESVPVGALVAVIADPDEDISHLVGGQQPVAAAAPGEALPPPAPPTRAAGPPRVKASPLARRMARERGIDLSAVAGSGPGGRVIVRDVPAGAPAPPRLAPLPGPATGAAGAPAAEVEERELSPMRRAIAIKMAQSMAAAPHFYLTTEVAMDRAMELRDAIEAQTDALALTFTDMIVKAVALALARHPAVNASFAEGRIRLYRRAHIGIAVALEDGLITPVLRDCDRKSLAQIAGESKALIERARARKLKPEEYTGGTFTVSNLGMFEIDEFTAVINPPEAAILAVGSIQRKPVVVGGQVAVGHRMRLTLSCDHRVIDGATGATFLQDVKRLLEQPLQLLL